MKRLAALLLLSYVPLVAQVPNCPSGFASSGSCGVSFQTGGQPFGVWGGASPSLSGSSIILLQTGGVHEVSAITYQTQVNSQAFSANFTFIPNGQNLAFVVQNSNNNPFTPQPYRFNQGAGCEAGFYQSSGYVPNFVFGIELDSYSPLTQTGNFSYSSTQLYQSTAPPCLPPNGSEAYWYTVNKISTSPVPLTLASGTGNGCTASPGNGCGTTTGDTYSATVIYTAGNVTLNLFDVTAGGTCTPTTSGTCFSQTWSGVNIPSIVGSNLAYMSISTASGNAAANPLIIKSFTDTTTTAPSSPPVQTYTSATSSGASFVATPTLSPAAGTYGSAQSVTPSSATANVYYCDVFSSTTPPLMPQTDGQGGCSAGNLVSGAISIPSTGTLYIMGGINVKTQPSVANYSRLPSNLVVAAYTIGGTPTLATPTFSPAGGTYSSTQTVTIGCAVGATCVYTTDGSTPTAAPPGTPTHGTVYTTPITVSSSQTINAIATEVGFFNSAVASAAYVIAPPAATPTFSPVGGTYTSVQTVTISTTTPSPTIHYTTDGSTPTLASPLYTAPIAISVSETVKAIATASGFSSSAVGTASYVINLPTASAPTFSPVAGTYAIAQSVSLSTTTSGGVICYKIGSAPPAPTTAGVCPSGTGYATPISVASSQTLFAYTTKASFLTSTTSQAAYVIEVPASTPTFSPGAGTYASVQTVNISSVTPGATIFYSFNCTVFTSSPAPPISVSGSGTVCAYATAPGFTQSVTGSAAYVINLPPAATPTFTPTAGTYTSIQNVTLASTTAGAFIFYTTDGSTPTPSSTPYTGPISVGSTQTINAIATAAGFSNSAVGTALYTINLPVVDTPEFSPCSPGPAPDCGTYASAQTVTISSTTVGASIYYTTNGSTPTTSSTLYTGPITVATSQTIKAIGVLAGMEDSDVGSAAYVITAIQLNCTILPGTTISGTVTIK